MEKISTNELRYKAVANSLEFLVGKSFKWGLKKFRVKRFYVKNGKYFVETDLRVFVKDNAQLKDFLGAIVICVNDDAEPAPDGLAAAVKTCDVLKKVVVSHLAVKRFGLTLDEAYVYAVFQAYREIVFDAAQIRALLPCLQSDSESFTVLTLSYLERKGAIVRPDENVRRWKYLNVK